ncbi:MAG TPA: FecR domain-containing protein, partial [Chitinophagaceae bacterium]|nr:FecR domain-containing protein [Chitinophagaceae bacterium]
MQDLFRKYLDNECSPEEVKELLAHFNAPANELVLRNLILESLASDQPFATDVDNQWNKATEETYQRIIKLIEIEKGRVVPIFRKTWFRVAAAAVLLIGSFIIYKFSGNNNSGKHEMVKIDTQKQDLGPGGSKAVLTLADGSQIILDSAANGHLASQGNTKVIKMDGQLAYNASSDLRTTEVLYNTITTPRGGQYQIVLSDGSKVWLNAASSLRFPSTFVGNERKVELTGEGYFEVAKNATKPFKVNVAGKEEVLVLGTHFNINSYFDETTINTTLLEGKVKVTTIGSGVRTNDPRLLSPGQQLQLNINGQITLNTNPDLDQVMAWKNGIFNFDNSDLQMVLRQISRWYGVDIIYEGRIPQR